MVPGVLVRTCIQLKVGRFPGAGAKMETQPSKKRYRREQAYQMAQHFELTESLNKLRHQNVFCDVTISFGKRCFPVHKAVLVASSNYFNAMFTSGFQEASCDKVTMHGNPHIFDILLQFIYTGELVLQLETAAKVLEMACYLQLDNATKSCAAFLVDAFRNQKITFEEALGILSVIDYHPQFAELKQWIDQCMSQNFTKIQHLDDQHWYLVSADLMNRMLHRSDLAADEEEVGSFTKHLDQSSSKSSDMKRTSQ